MIEPNSDTQRLTAEQIRGKAEYKRWFACAVDPEGTAITPAYQASLWDREKHHGVDHTHQLFAHYFYLRAPRANAQPLHSDAERKKFMVQLAHHIHKEARWDLRVNDLYFQRLATLLMIGRAYLIKPRWVERVMAKQLADGGWSWKS